MNGCTAEPVVGGGLGGSGPAQELQPTKQQPHLAAAAATSVFETHYTKEYKGRGAFCLGTAHPSHAHDGDCRQTCTIRKMGLSDSVQA